MRVKKKKKISCCNSYFSLVGLGAKIVCVLTAEPLRDASYSAPAIWSAWQGELSVTMTSYIPSTV